MPGIEDRRTRLRRLVELAQRKDMELVESEKDGTFLLVDAYSDGVLYPYIGPVRGDGSGGASLEEVENHLLDLTYPRRLAHRRPRPAT